MPTPQKGGSFYGGLALVFCLFSEGWQGVVRFMLALQHLENDMASFMWEPKIIESRNGGLPEAL